MAKQPRGKGARIVRDLKASKLPGKDKKQAPPGQTEVNFGNVNALKLNLLNAINMNLIAMRKEMKGYFNG